MAQIPFQRGELTDRVRRFTGLVGPYVGSVDELVSPVLVTDQLNRPPYRTNGQRWYSNTGVTAPAGPCYMHLTSGPASHDILIVDGWSYELDNWDGSSYTLSLALGKEAAFLGGAQNLVIPEQTSDRPLVWHQAQGEFLGNLGNYVVPPAGAWNMQAAIIDVQRTSFVTPEIVVEPGLSLIWQFGTINADHVSFNVTGLFFPGGLGGEV